MFSRLIPPMATTGMPAAAVTVRMVSLEMGLGPGDEGRPAAQIVRPGLPGPAGLLRRMGGDADDLIRPQQLPGAFRLQIALAHMDAVGSGGQGDVRPVVDDADGPQSAAQGHKALCLRQEGSVLQALFPELDDGRAPPDGVLNLAEKSLLVRRPGPVGDGVKPEYFRSYHGEVLLKI